MTDQEAFALVAEAQREQLKKPNRAVVNSEAAFVAQRLRDAGHFDLAARYWRWVCPPSKDDFDETVHELQAKLKEIDLSVSMPAWGTYGT